MTASDRFEGRASARHDEIEARIGEAARWQPEQMEALRREVREAVAAEMSSEVQFGYETVAAAAALRKWQLLHKYIQRIPFHDDPGEPRSRQWQEVMKKVRPLDDLELIQWVDMKVDSALRHERRGDGGVQRLAGATYLVLLNNIAARKRQAQAAVRWAKEAGDKGWTSCNTHTLGPALLRLHADSVYARDNPAYEFHTDGPYRREPRK